MSGGWVVGWVWRLGGWWVGGWTVAICSLSPLPKLLQSRLACASRWCSPLIRWLHLRTVFLAETPNMLPAPQMPAPPSIQGRCHIQIADLAISVTWTDENQHLVTQRHGANAAIGVPMV